MSVTAPDWLTQRTGGLRLAPDGRTWLLLLNDSPQYKLTPTPADGKWSCFIQQSVNGKRIDGGAVYPTREEAVHGGLEELRGKLGW